MSSISKGVVDKDVSVSENILMNCVTSYANVFYIIEQLDFVGFNAEDTGDPDHIGTLLFDTATRDINSAFLLLLNENNVKVSEELVNELEAYIQDYCMENTRSEFEVHDVINELKEIIKSRA